MKNLRSLTALSLVGVALLLVLAVHHVTRAQPEVASWPTPEAREAAVEIPLSRAWGILVTPEGARHAAVIGDMIYLELHPASGMGTDGAVTDGTGGADIRKARMPFPSGATVTRLAEVAAVDLTVHTGREGPSLLERALQFAPILLLIGLMAFFLLRGATGSLGLSRSFDVIEGARLREGFDDVAGIDAARGEIVEIVDFLKDPVAASRLGGRMPKGVLFDGPPGSGKTLLARAMAREAGVPFITIDAAGMNQIFVGAGAMKIRKVFKEARKRAPCIVFIDEIDSMGRARGARGGAGDEKETTLNALLVELDGFGPREGIVVIAATNRPEILDAALTRRGRIDRRITVNLPDIEGRKAILAVHARRIAVAPNLDLSGIAGTTFGFSGADLAALTNEAALHATRNGRAAVTMEDFAAARDRMIVGMSGSNRKMDAEDLKLTAVHEAGHAMIAALEPDSDPIEKVTILPQGRAAGFVMQSPDRDRIFETRGRLQARIRIAVAGRIAEETVFGPDAVTSGAVSDIEQATRIAREMVVTLGMSDLGFIRLDQSDFALHDIDNPPVREIRKIIEQAQAHVAAILSARREDLERLSEELMRREVMDGADVARILGLKSHPGKGRAAA